MTREEAIKRLQEVKVWAKDDDLTVIDMAIEALKERPTGHWRDDGEMMWCTNCGHGEDAYFGCYDEPIHGNGMIGWARRYPAYCKRCGAKMGENDDERFLRGGRLESEEAVKRYEQDLL